MQVLTLQAEKEKCRTIENSLFDKLEWEPNCVIKKYFPDTLFYEHGLLGHKDLFIELKSKFSQSDFYISTIIEDEPIFLLSFITNSINEYYSILNSPEILNLTCLDAGLSITNERIFFYDVNQNWCLFADRFNDVIILKY